MLRRVYIYLVNFYLIYNVVFVRYCIRDCENIRVFIGYEMMIRKFIIIIGGSKWFDRGIKEWKEIIYGEIERIVYGLKKWFNLRFKERMGVI